MTDSNPLVLTCPKCSNNTEVFITGSQIYDEFVCGTCGYNEHLEEPVTVEKLNEIILEQGKLLFAKLIGRED